MQNLSATGSSFDCPITTYQYDPDGHRVEMDDGVDVTQFIYDGNNVLQETDDVGVVEAEFTYIPQEYAHVVSQDRDGTSSFYHFDGINNTSALTDDAEVVTDAYAVDAWGKLRSSTGSTANSQIYKGEFLAYYKDPNAGPESIYSLHHRNYSTDTGRMTSEDPAKDDLNLYCIECKGYLSIALFMPSLTGDLVGMAAILHNQAETTAC